MTYDYNSTEELTSRYRVIDSGLRYYEHDLLVNCTDGAFSQQNAIILTKSKDIKTVFNQQTTYVDIKNFACCFYLSVTDTDILSNDTKIKSLNKTLYVGGKGTEVIFNAIPIEEGVIELKVNNQLLAVSENYPYNLILLNEPLQENVHRQRFLVEVLGNKIALKSKTNAGYRYLSYSNDRILRCIGLQLNETIINQYLLTPIFISEDNMFYDFDSSTKETRYYNEFGLTSQETTVDVKKQIQVDTSLLVSCSLEDVVNNEEVNVNIAITKTNFATSGTYNTSL
jgi:hypothetical protein